MRVVYVFTWITGLKTCGYIWLYSFRPKSVSAGINCGLGCMRALYSSAAAE